MEKLSAAKLGAMLGLSAQEMNVLLKEEGFIKGEPGNYSPTDKGKEYSDELSDDNGYGGYCARWWSWLVWPQTILDEIDTSDERLSQIREKTVEERRERKAAAEAEADERFRQFCAEKEANTEETENFSAGKVLLAMGAAALAALGIAIFRK